MKYLVNKTINFKSILFRIVLLLFSTMGVAQVNINKEWTQENGNPYLLEWFNSITTENNDLITVGNTFVPGQGANVLVTRFNKLGDKLWEKDFNSNGSANDYGIALAEDDLGNVYVIGTTDNNSITDYDVVILKYSSNGVLVWSKQWDSGEHLKDIGTGIVTDGNENIFVSISSETAQTRMDYLTMKLDGNGNVLWKNRYDNNFLDDTPIGIDVLQGGNVVVMGASASAIDSWDYTTIVLSNSGVHLNEERVNISNGGFDRPLAFTKDSEGNIYITGKTSTNGLNYDMTTIKIDTDYSLAWVETIDYAGSDDQANAIVVDEEDNLYVGGYVTKNNGAKAMAIIKYDSNGNELWRQIQSANIPNLDVSVKSLEKNENGTLFYAIEETLENGELKGALAQIKEDGETVWKRTINYLGSNVPTTIRKATDGTLYLTALKGNSNPTYETMRYTSRLSDTSNVYNANGEPIYRKNQLIVRFKPEALDSNVFDKVDREYGSLEDFLKPWALNVISDEFNKFCNECRIEIAAIRLFPHLTTGLTTAIGRLGNPVKIPDFWTTLLLEFYGNVTIEQAHNFLKTIPNIVAYSEPNFYAKLTNGANDAYYNDEQASLHPTPLYSDGHINIEEAWSIFPDAGYPFVKCGVFDDGIQFLHEDFGYDGNNISTSKIKGWDFESNQNLTAMQDSSIYFKHGTPCAGIIGALRNNDIGIAGIAGGNMQDDNTGVSLYGFRMFQSTQNSPVGVPFPDSLGAFSPLQYFYDALVMSAIDSILDYTYGLHVSSNSWRIDDSLYAGPPSNPFFTDTNITLLKEAVHFNNRMQVTFVAARGNEGYNSNSYPAILDDDWVLSVGGSGRDGSYKTIENGDPLWVPSYGQKMDVTAPSTSEIIYSTHRNPNGIGSYGSFNGTSAAAPHVAGVVSLLMSYLNDPFPSYNNLAPEDCERIIELSATDVGPVGYDSLNGWGRLDAGAALRLVEKNKYKVHHFGTHYFPNTKETIQTEYLKPITLKEQVQNANGNWFPRGAYKVNAFQITAEIVHALPSSDSIMYYWARPSMSTVFESIKYDSLLPRERVYIDSTNFSQSNCVLSGYVYEVFDMNNNAIGWLPFDTTLTKAHFEYTVLTKNISASGMNKEALNQENWVTLYPNPSKNNQQIVLELPQNTPFQIELYDINGRLIKSVFNGNTKENTTNITVDISKLSQGIYFYTVHSGEKVKSLKFIKQ